MKMLTLPAQTSNQIPNQIPNQTPDHNQNPTQALSRNPVENSDSRPGAEPFERPSPARRPAALNPLLRHPDLWQAGQLKPVTGVCATGYEALDDALNGGWPSAGITELLHDAPGIGELQLLLPAMRELSRAQQRWLVWINPPYQPCAPALEAAGVDIRKILLVHPRNAEQALWALEQSLKSGGSAMVLCWFGQHSGLKTLNEDALTPAQSPRLQLAARQGNSFGCLFRSTAVRKQPSMASLRLQLESTPATRTGDHRSGGELTVHVRKQRGGWPVQDLTLTLDYVPVRQQQQQQAVQEQLVLWRHGRRACQQFTGARPSPSRQSAEAPGQPLQTGTGALLEPRVLH